MRQAASCDSPGSSTTRSTPELKASGGQVIGSTARPTRFVSGNGVSAVCTCTHGQRSSNVIATPWPSAARTVTAATPDGCRSRDVNAWSMNVSPISRSSRKSNSGTSSTASTRTGLRRSSVTSSTSDAGRLSVQASTPPSPAHRYGCGPVPHGAGTSSTFVAVTVWVSPSMPTAYSVCTVTRNG